ncbi:LOW QUALITY PROTEIN: NCK-interacting protein with SH3 domain [Homalodisca vitripennis]|uniref:LOW QUALITY PROTEIN: NCK-interacting protein with SH3 domain n=1 Tax=Homalodisca vitripennis TaxID=197043 RepID=UPI001EEC1580|nr:LOW QUALITY PROTEIN: NCK-interacting protein with SH3 domain [Homalodisca vitripennis]
MLRALYDFESTIPQTINFSKGDFFVLHPSINKQRNWWHVISVTGQVGYVPNNYVQTVEVGSRCVLDFLTKCIKALDKDNQANSSSRRQELINELKKRRHFLAMRIAPRDSRSPIPPQRVSSSPSTPRCSSALAFASNTANSSDIFSNLGKNATLPKSKKQNAPKKPVRSATSDTNSLTCTNTPEPGDDLPSMPNGRVSSHGDDLGPESVYNLVQEVRKATHLNYELSKVAITVVLRGLQELVPPHSTPSLLSVQSLLSGDLSMPARILDKTHDAQRLRLVLQELVSCKEDAQQRSWELYEDEAVISEYLHELISILENADPVICRRVLSQNGYEEICTLLQSQNGYEEICTLLQYYQMEVRWPIRQLLIKSLCVMCAVHPPVISILLNSVLPMELARDMMSNTRNISRLTNSSALLTRIFSTGESMPVTHLEHVGSEFVTFLLAFIEEPPETDSADVIPDTFLRVVLAYNLQFPPHSSHNLVLEALARRNNAKVFTEKILLILNREDDPLRAYSSTSGGKSIFKMFYDLFSFDKTAALVYTNDIKVLIDMIVRQLTDLSPGDARRSEYLKLCRMVLRNSNYYEHKHRISDLQKCFTRIFCEDTLSSHNDQALVRDISNEFPQYFKG